MVNSCYYFWLCVDTYGVNFPSIKPCGEHLTSTRQSDCVCNHQHRFQHRAPNAFAFIIIMQFIIASDTIVESVGKTFEFCTQKKNGNKINVKKDDIVM